MMYGSNSVAPWIWLHVHWLFWGIAIFGFVAALLWLYKHASKKDFLNVVWLSLVVGVLGGLLTASVALAGWTQMMGAHHDSWGERDWDEDREEMWDAMEDYWGDLDENEDFDMGGMMDSLKEDNS